MNTPEDRYRTYLVDLLSRVPTRGGPTAICKLFSASLVSTTTSRLHNDSLLHILRSAHKEFGGTVGTLIQYCIQTKTWHAMVVYEEEGRVVKKSTPLYFSHNTITASGGNNAEIQLKPGCPLFFHMTIWIARQVFGLHTSNAFPLLHRTVHDELGFRPDTQAFYNVHHELSPTDILQLYDAYIHDYATHTHDFDHMEASIIDILHAFGAIYIGSVQESTSHEETVHIRKALDRAQTHGVTHLWWIEDYTLFEQKFYKLVIRYNMAGKPYCEKRRLCLRKNRERLQDVATKRVSNDMNWDYGECGILDFNKWVESFLAIPSARALPYLRDEILTQCQVRPAQYPCTRPYLVNGEVADVPIFGHVAPRLAYSPDLFVQRSKIPPGSNPCTVHFQVNVKPRTSTDTDGLDIRMFLRIGNNEKDAFRVLFTKDGHLFPEEDQLRVFVQSVDENTLGEDALQLVVLRRRLAPCGTTVVEFLLTSHWKPFRLYVDNKTCDYDVRIALSQYNTAQPRVFDSLDIPVYSSHHKLRNGAFDTNQYPTKSLVPMIYVENEAFEKYQFLYYDGLALISIC